MVNGRGRSTKPGEAFTCAAQHHWPHWMSETQAAPCFGELGTQSNSCWHGGTFPPLLQGLTAFSTCCLPAAQRGYFRNMLSYQQSTDWTTPALFQPFDFPGAADYSAVIFQLRAALVTIITQWWHYLSSIFAPISSSNYGSRRSNHLNLLASC